MVIVLCNKGEEGLFDHIYNCRFITNPVEDKLVGIHCAVIYFTSQYVYKYYRGGFENLFNYLSARMRGSMKYPIVIYS